MTVVAYLFHVFPLDHSGESAVILYRSFVVVRRPLDVPQHGKSASFLSCVRAGGAKLRVCVREIMLLYAGLPILEFLSSPSSPSSSLMEH